MPQAWWNRWPGRLDAELTRFADLGLPVDHNTPGSDDDQIVVRTTARLPDGATTPVVVVYPDGYPDRRFAVYAPELRLAKHESFDGNLCVFPRGAEYWDPTTLAADVVAADVPDLIRLVRENGPELRALEDPQGEPATSYYPYEGNGGVVLDERALAVSPDLAGGRFAIGLDRAGAGWLDDAVAAGEGTSLWDMRTGLAMLVSVADPTGRELLSGGAGRGPGFEQGQCLEGRWARLPAPPWTSDPQELWTAVEAAADAACFARPVQNGWELLGLVVAEEVAPDEHADAWVFLVRRVSTAVNRQRSKRKGPTPPRRDRTVLGPVLLRGMRWTEQDLALRIPELAPLRSKTAALVGLGSLGASLAAEFAKAQIGGLRVVDFDYLDPATAVRHPLGLAKAGQLKPLAVLRWLQEQWPNTVYGGGAFQSGAAGLRQNGPGEREALGEMLHGASLLVSAAAENDVNRQLDRTAADLGLPRLRLWGVSGYGGVIALLRPGATGCYHCLELFESDRAGAGSPLVRVPAGMQNRLVQGRGCGDRTFTANHADLLPIVAQAARMAFGVLCAGNEGGYPQAPGDVFAVQLRAEDGTPIPPAWTAAALPPDPRCAQCSAA
jgi:hypothetical protein